MPEGEGLGSWVWVTLDSGWLYRSVCLGRHSFWPSGAGYCRFYPIRRATLHAPGETSPSNLEGLAGGVREWPARMRLNASGCAKFIIIIVSSPYVRSLDEDAFGEEVRASEGEPGRGPGVNRNT